MKQYEATAMLIVRLWNYRDAFPEVTDLVSLNGDFHILPHLSEGIIIGTDACEQNKMIIDFTTNTVSINGHNIPATATKPTKLPSKKKRGVYADAAVTIQPGQGAALPIQFSTRISKALPKITTTR